MKPIRIFTPGLTFISEIDDYESLILTRKYHSAGTFQITININKLYTDTLAINNLVVLSPDNVGLIRHREIRIDENGSGSEALVVSGPTLSGVLKSRVTVPPGGGYDVQRGPAETVMKAFVDHNAISAADEDRNFEALILGADQARGPQVYYQTRYKNLEEELETLSMATGIGWNIGVDLAQLKWVFDVYEGADRTSGNTAGNSPVVFSTDFDNIKSQSFVESLISSSNSAYVGGQGESTDREIVEIGPAAGLDRSEVFIDARDIGPGTEDPPPMPQEITDRLIARGQQKLSELQPVMTFESEVLSYGPFSYETDWDLGDLVTIQNTKWGVTLNARITEVTEVYEPGGFRLSAVFGNSIPTLVDKLRAALSNVSGEISK